MPMRNISIWKKFSKFSKDYVYLWIVGICEKAVIDTDPIDSHRKNLTYLGENLQFCFKTEGFQSHYSFGKTFSFSLKTEGNTNCSVWLKQKVFQQKPSVFFYKKTKRKLNRTEGNTRSLIFFWYEVLPSRGCCAKFPTGLNIIISHSSKVIWVIKVSFCQNDSPMR